MKNWSLQLKIGSIVILILLAMVLFPVLFTRINPYSTESMRAASDSQGHFIIENAPFPPQSGILLGTDEVGRHIWPLLVYGTKLTMLLAFLIVAGRFLIALPMGFSAGFGSILARTVIQQFSVIFGTIPALLLCIILLKMNFFTELEKNPSIIAFVLILTIVGWGRLGQVIQSRVETLLKEPFIQGEIAIGKNRFQIAAGTLLNHLMPELLVFFSLEMARALTLLLQLGVFGVFVGNVRFIEDTDQGVIKTMNISYEPEWASMLGAARNNIRFAPWTVFFPALAFFISVMGLNAFGEGMRSVLQRKTDSVRLAFEGMKHRRILAAALCALIVAYNVVPAVYRSQLFMLDDTLAESLVLEDAPVVIGNANAALTAIWIAEELKKRGLYTLNSSSYIHDYKIVPAFYPASQKVGLNRSGKNQSLRPESDFQWISFGSFNISGILQDYSHQDLYQMDAADVKQPGILLLDTAFYNRESILYLTQRLAGFPNVRGIVWLTDMQDLRVEQIGAGSFRVPALYLDRSLIDRGNQGAVEIILQIDSGRIDGRGKNILAYTPGVSERMGEDAILYGFSYNALTPEETRIKLNYSFAVIDALRKDYGSRNRTMIVAFFDGTLSDDFNGMKAYVEEKPYSQKKTLLFMDMTRVEGIPAGQLIMDRKQSPITRYYAYTFAIQLDEKKKQLGWYPDQLRASNESDTQLFIKQGTPTLILGLKAPKQGEGTVTLDKLGKALIQVISANNY